MHGPPLQVLLVDGDRQAAGKIGSLLAQSPTLCQLTVVATMREGISMLPDGHFDVALVGYHEHSRTASEMLDELRAAGAETPLILLTEEFDPLLDTEVIAAGADDYLCYDELTSRQLLRTIRYS